MLLRVNEDRDNSSAVLVNGRGLQQYSAYGLVPELIHAEYCIVREPIQRTWESRRLVRLRGQNSYIVKMQKKCTVQ